MFTQQTINIQRFYTYEYAIYYYLKRKIPNLFRMSESIRNNQNKDKRIEKIHRYNVSFQKSILN